MLSTSVKPRSSHVLDLEPVALQPATLKRLADSDANGVFGLEAVSERSYSSTCKPLVLCCMDMIFNYLPGYQLIEASSFITPHTPRKLDACDLFTRLSSMIVPLLLDFEVTTIFGDLRRKSFAAHD
jgi:hypothetical protein